MPEWHITFLLTETQTHGYARNGAQTLDIPCPWLPVLSTHAVLPGLLGSAALQKCLTEVSRSSHITPRHENGQRSRPGSPGPLETKRPQPWLWPRDSRCHRQRVFQNGARRLDPKLSRKVKLFTENARDSPQDGMSNRAQREDVS